MPPNLDLTPPTAQQLSLNSLFDKILNYLVGFVCRLDSEGRIEQISANWDELAARTGRASMARNELLGAALWDALAEGELRTNLRTSFTSLARGLSPLVSHVLDFSNPQKPCMVSFSIHALREDGRCTGFIVQAIDVTTEHVGRMLLLDRERRMKELRGELERSRAKIATLESSAANLESRLAAEAQEQHSFDEERSAFQQEIAELHDHIASLQTQVNTLQDLNAAQQHQIALLTEQGGARDQQNSAYREQVRTLEDVVRNQQEKVVRLNAKLDEASRPTPAENDKTWNELLTSLRESGHDLGADVCRIACEKSGAMFVTLAKYWDNTARFRFSAHHNAPEFHQYAIDHDVLEMEMGEGPAGITAQKGYPTKFDHLLTRDDFTKWAPLAEQNGYNCIWAFPLADEHGIYGILQLYFAEEDCSIAVESYERLMRLCQYAAPLLRLSDAWPKTETATAETHETNGKVPTDGEGFRVLAADLAEEFGNLLTGVLGHSSLAAAEVGDSHAAIEDVRAIERSARGAAKLTRRLAALCGANHKTAVPLDVTSYLKTYVTRDRKDFFPSGIAGVAVPGQQCPVHIEPSTLEIMLDGLAEHARSAQSGSEPPTWDLSEQNESMILTLTYSGPMALPAWWDQGKIPANLRAQMPELVFTREAAQAHGGTLEVSESGGTTHITLMLPFSSKLTPA